MLLFCDITATINNQDLLNWNDPENFLKMACCSRFDWDWLDGAFSRHGEGAKSWRHLHLSVVNCFPFASHLSLSLSLQKEERKKEREREAAVWFDLCQGPRVLLLFLSRRRLLLRLLDIHPPSVKDVHPHRRNSRREGLTRSFSFSPPRFLCQKMTWRSLVHSQPNELFFQDLLKNIWKSRSHQFKRKVTLIPEVLHYSDSSIFLLTSFSGTLHNELKFDCSSLNWLISGSKACPLKSNNFR